MKIMINLMTSVGVIVFAWCNQAVAQDEEQAPQLVPSETYACNYLEGKDRSDLDKVIARWNKWADEHNPVPYTAWVLTPNFVGSDIGFDIAWSGSWPSYAAMGKALQTWSDDGDEMNAAFSSVVSCDQHALMAVLPLQAPGDPPEKSLVRFSDCTLDKDIGPEQAFEAHMEFRKYMQSKGSKTRAWMLFPDLGAGKIEFDYKFALGNPNYASLGKDMEIITNGGGWKEARKVLGGTTNCDSFRLYEADLVRNGMAK